jgi:putative two-component system response regulator
MTTHMHSVSLNADQLLRLVCDLHQLRTEFKEARAELAHAHQLTLSRLALTATLKDHETGKHIARIGVLSAMLAARLGQAADWCAHLAQAAPMHDIGKIGIPDGILQKPAALTADEREIMETHPTIGAKILGGTGVAVLDMAAEIALTHHERWDGSGYPAQLKGEAIPLAGRIVAAIDYFDALSMDRCYRKALPDEEVTDLLKVTSGTLFDPIVTHTLLAMLPELREARMRINELLPTDIFSE